MKTILQQFLLILFLTLAGQCSYAQTQWIGNTSVNWATASNWTNGVPTATTDVIIGDANFTGPFQPTISSTANAKSLTIGVSMPSVLTVSSALTVKGDITIASNGELVNGAASISLTGNWQNNGTFSVSTTNSTVIFSGITQSVNGTTLTVFKNMTVNTGSILTLNANIQCTGTASVLIVNGTLNPSESPARLVTADSIVVNSGAVLKVTADQFTSNYQVLKPVVLNAGSIVEYGATSIDQTISSTLTYSTLRVSGAGTTKSLAGNLPLLRATGSTTGSIYVLSGTLDLKTFSANRGTTVAGGTLSVSNNAFLKVGGANNFPSGYTTNTLPLASTVEYNGDDQAVAAKTYGNLILSASSGNRLKTLPATAFTIAASLTSSVTGGATLTFTAGANITVTGSMNIGPSTTFNGVSYSHSITGNWNNNGSFNPGTSTITMKGANTTLGGAPTQNFYNLTITGANVSVTGTADVNVSGNFVTSGSGSFFQSASGALNMIGTTKSITGVNINLNDFNVSGTISSTATMNIAGYVAVSGSFTSTGIITLTGTGKTIANAGTLSFRTLKISGSVTTSSPFTVTSTFTNTGTFTAYAGTITFAGSTTLTGVVNLCNVNISTSYLRLAANAVLGITGTITTTSGGYLRTTSYSPNTVNYNGAGAQNILNTTYNNLTLSNGNSKTAIGAITINNALTIATATTFSAGTFTHYVNGNWINNGTFNAGTSTIQFKGTTNTTISGTTTFSTLYMYKSVSATTVTMLSDVAATTVNMYRGTLNTGTKTLTITGSRSNNDVILGTVTRTHTFSAGVAYAFEGPYTTVTFGTATGITSVTVKTTIGNVGDFPFNGAVGRTYTISTSGGSYTNAKLRLHYLDAELNGNDETKMQLWRYNGSAWVVSGKTANSTTNNYVENNNIPDISNRWTFTDDGSVLAWKGAVSSDWNNAANWSLVYGTFSGVPGATDIVEIGKQSFTNQPEISSIVKVKSITFGSVKNANLALLSGSLTVDGSIQGIWSGNASHKIISNGYPVTINNDLILGDGVAGHDITMEMANGVLTVVGSVTQSGTGALSLTTGTMKVGKNYDYTGGTFISGTGTVLYNGSATQQVAPVGYYHLTITKSAGSNGEINSFTTVAGNLSITSGELDLLNNITVSGNVNITTTAILDAGASVISCGGNWSRSVAASFVPGTGTVILNGTGSQNISDSIFNNLTVNKLSGVVAISRDLTVENDLSITAGRLNVSTFSINSTETGNNFSMADGTNLFVSGANNFPANFNDYNLAANSIVTYDGTIAQTVAPVSYGNLMFSNGGSAGETLAGNLTVKGDITLNSGAQVNGADAVLTLLGNWSNSGTFDPQTSTVLLNGTVKTLSGNTTFNNITVSGDYSVLSADMTYNGEFYVTSAGRFNSGVGVATLYGDFTNEGYAFSPGTTTFAGTRLQSIHLFNALLSTSTGVVNFNGNVAPELSSTSSPTFATLNINNTAGVSASVDWYIMVAFNVNSGGIFNGMSSTHNVYGAFTNNGTVTSDGILNFVPSTPVTLQLKGTQFSSTGKVIFGGSGNITITGQPTNISEVIIANTNSAGITFPSGWNIADDFSVKSNSIFHAGAYSHTIGGNVEIDGTLDGGTSTFTMTSSSGKLTGSPGTLFNNFVVAGNIAAFSDFGVGGDFTNNGTYDGSLGAIIMPGNKPAEINGLTNPSSIDQLIINKDSGVVVTAAVDIDGVSTLMVNSGTFFTASQTISQNGAGGALIVMDGATLKIGGNNTLPAFSGYGLEVRSNVEYAGVTQKVSQAGAGYGNLIISAPGDKTAMNFLPITIAGNLVITAGNFIAGNSTHSLKGNWIMTGGTFTNTASTIQFNGTEDQYIQSPAAFNNVTINKLSGRLTLTNDLAVNGTLKFIKGNITTDAFKVIIPASMSVASAAQTTGWIFGNLQMNINAGIGIVRKFEIGDSLNYMPLQLTFLSVSTGGDLTATIKSPDHPEADYSRIDTTKSVNRYWSVATNGVVFTSASAKFNWRTSTIDATAVPANFGAAIFAGGDWTMLSVSNRTGTSLDALGLTFLGDFEIGESISQFKWTGAGLTSDWYLKTNWSGGIPDNTTDVLIPADLKPGRLFPVLTSGTTTVNTISVESGASLVVNNCKLQVGGNLTASGGLDLKSGTLEMNGSATQTISGSAFSDRVINHLMVSNTGTSLSIGSTLNDTLKITGALTFGAPNSILNTGDNLTLVSNKTGTANVGILNFGNAINGNVVVERFINTGTAAGEHLKSWQLLATPANGQTVKSGWMESGATGSTGYGVFLTGPGGVAAGFDAPSYAPSIKYYDPVTGSYTGVSNANNLLYRGSGYFVYVRGDRGVTSIGQAPNNTTLRSKGSLITGTLPPVEILPNKYASVGNPYASVIDFSLIQKSPYVDEVFYVWDPYLYGTYGQGGYQTISSINNWVPVPGGTLAYPAGIANSTIQSGQAFMVHSTISGPPPPYNAEITITEDCKTGSAANTMFARPYSPRTGGNGFFRVNLFTGITSKDVMADGNVVVFNKSFSNGVDGKDAAKLTNSGENFGLKRNGNLLALEARSGVSATDTIFYNMTNLRAQSYQLRFAPENMSTPGLQAFLIDRYLNTTTPLRLDSNSTHNFSVTTNAQSSAADRFKVVFIQSTVLPVVFTHITATQSNLQVMVQWKVSLEKDVKQYEVQRSADGINFTTIGSRYSDAAAGGNYALIDQQPLDGWNYYRVKNVDVDGNFSYSPVVRVEINNLIAGFQAYPNPVTGKKLYIDFLNQQPGDYQIVISNSAGQQVQSLKINIQSAVQKIQMDWNGQLPRGIYNLQISRQGMETKTILLRY